MRVEEIGNALGMYFQNNAIMANRRGYDIQMDVTNNNIYVVHILVDQSINLEKRREIAEALDYKNRIDKNGYDDFFTIFLTDLMGFKTTPEKVALVNSKIDLAIELLEHNGFLPMNHCGICQEDKDDELVYCFHKVRNYDNVLTKVHQSCLDSKVKENETEILANENNKKAYPISILLALLFSFIVVVGIYFLLVGLGYYFGIVFALIPLAGQFGYNLGKAPRNKLSLGIIIAETILQVFLLYVFIVRALAVVSQVSSLEVIKLISGDIVTGVIFTIIGIAIAIPYMKKYLNSNRRVDINK